jgi:hypothetical protein
MSDVYRDDIADEGDAVADIDHARSGIAHAVARFPDAAAELRRLAIAEPEFRNLCEEYGLAHESLARFEALPDAAERPEVLDYRSIIDELEKEITCFLS